MKNMNRLFAFAGTVFLLFGLGSARTVHAEGNVEKASASSVISVPSTETSEENPSPSQMTTGSIPHVSYNTHIKNVGWSGTALDGAQSGKTSNLYDIEALHVQLTGIDATEGGVSYQVQSRNIGWQSESANGATAGTTGRNLPVEAVKIRLTGPIATQYSVYYRVFIEGTGWTKYASDNQLAGTVGLATNVEAIQVRLVKKTDQAPAEDTNATFSSLTLPTLNYSVQSKNIGWGPSVASSGIAGTVGKALRAESFKLSLGNLVGGLTGGISYQAHVKNKGWLPEVHDGQIAGTVGEKLQLEAFKIHLTGQVANYFSVYYRAQVSNIGWTTFTTNGQIAGSIGANQAVEAIQIIIAPKQKAAPSAKSSVPYSYLNKPAIIYQAHSATIGWGAGVSEGEIAGTVGRNLRLEAMKANVTGLIAGETGGVTYRAYVQNKGWLAQTGNNGIGGTTGLALHAEALSLQLTGEVSKYYDIWYQVHVQNAGWMGWAKNGASAGTTGMNRQIEAFRVRILAKGTGAPGTTKDAFAAAWRSVGGQLKFFNAKTNSYTKTFSLKYYSQLDKRWSGKTYSGYNFGKTGCGQASIAMIISGFGINVTPPMAADYAHKYGTFDTAAGAGSTESDLTLVADKFGLDWIVMKSQAELSSYLAQGYPATVCLDLGGTVRHIVVLTGNKGGYTTVSDPWNNLLFSGKHAISQVWSK